MKKFTFIGAGSLQFTTSCMRDLLTFPAFRDCEIALMDVNRENLDNVYRVCLRIREAMNCPDCKITTTMDRVEALRGADAVLCTVFNGGIDIWRHDIEVPKKYGVDTNIGDTRSVSGIFRALRNIPLLLEIVPVGNPDRRILENALLRQIESLAKYQDEGGMWHTLIDDPTSYLEASATSGFGFGILKAVEQGIVPESYRANAMRALQPVLDCIDEKGVVQQVSYGTPMGRESKDFYKQIPLHPMPYGQAMAILFLMEAEAQV